ncbi:MAG TPA: YggS family pyridoxal phosphate-dependent enzyme [Gemmataceae bacterium]|nr:YggS family pyridoxal phosphate-dependent enzyme [Gemmataceae bacterium]
MQTLPADILQQRLAEVEDRIADACRRSGRKRAAVTLVAVTKTVSAEIAGLLPALGICDLGESRPQELWKKANALVPAVRWHLVGHLQRNKIEKTLPLVHMIHSVDSLRLLLFLENEAMKQERQIPVLLEVNASREPQKNGFAPQELDGLPPKVEGFQFVRIEGLMTMAALNPHAEASRQTFAELRDLRDQLKDQFPSPHRLEHLSMGMSNDFEVAIEEGATMVRLGSVLFEGLNP